jgi:hypothetical protein
MNDSKIPKAGNALGAAIRKKTDAAGKAIGGVLAKPAEAWHGAKKRQHDKNYEFIKTYNAKPSKTNKERAQYQQLQDAYKSK